MLPSLRLARACLQAAGTLQPSLTFALFLLRAHLQVASSLPGNAASPAGTKHAAERAGPVMVIDFATFVSIFMQVREGP